MTENPDETIMAADPGGDAAQGCVAAYFAELATRFPGGFDPGPPGDGDEFRSPRGLFLVALRAGQPVGCVGLRAKAPGVGEVKRLWIAPEARGTGLAHRLMAAVEGRARAMGLATLRLDTNATLTEAMALYRRLGWTEIARYNDNPYAQHWFEKPL